VLLPLGVTEVVGYAAQG
jgi:hypothetical protein